MSEAVTLLSVQEAVAAADRIYDQVDRAPSLARGLTGVPDRHLISVVVLARQLDRIARAAAEYATGHPNLEAWALLQEQLLAAGYLPLPPRKPLRRPIMAKPNPVPRTDEQAEAQLARYGVLKRAVDAAELKHTEAVALMKGQLAATTRPLSEEMEKLRAGLQAWAARNRARLTGNGKTKTVQLATGKISWKSSAGKVEIDGEEASVIEAIQGRIVKLTERIARAVGNPQGLVEEREILRSFLREKLEVARTVMRGRPEIAQTLPGVRIVPGAEEFKIEPLAAQNSEVA